MADTPESTYAELARDAAELVIAGYVDRGQMPDAAVVLSVAWPYLEAELRESLADLVLKFPELVAETGFKTNPREKRIVGLIAEIVRGKPNPTKKRGKK